MRMMEEDDKYIETMRLLVDQERLNQDIRSGSRDVTDDTVLEKQVDINTRRHRFNIVDREEIIYIDDVEKKEFVQ